MTLKVPLRDEAAIIAGGDVRLSEPTDPRGCKCCAAECEVEVAIQISFCGMTVNFSIQAPGFLAVDNTVILPDGSYLIPSASIYCTPCGWWLGVNVCAWCAETNVFASDGWTAEIPLAAAEEDPGPGYCPEAGPVDLICFGLQFGIPCVATASAVIA